MDGYSVTCNGTKNSPCLQADIFGDWREEIIVFNNEDKQTLNIFSTVHETAARVPCLMTDHTYRLGIAWQNSGYNQPLYNKNIIVRTPKRKKLHLYIILE